MATLNDVMLALGRVQGAVESLADELAEEKRDAKENRVTIHHRLDVQTLAMGDLATTVALAAQSDTQLREDLAAVAKDVKANHAFVAPSVQDWKSMKRVGIGLTGLLALGGVTLWSLLWWAGDAAINAVRAWLRIT